MGGTIEFRDFDIAEGSIDLSCVTRAGDETKDDRLEFRFNRPFVPSDDLIALALSTLCGQSYSQVHIGLDVSQKTLQAIEAFTGATVTVRALRSAPVGGPTTKRDKIILNFSGGFDSLAARAVMPESAQLVSVDFGGWFTRETEFFEAFDPCILTTNFRQLKYDRSSWTFMGVGAILFSDYLEAGYNVFGTVLEASMDQLGELPAAGRVTSTQPFSAAGLEDIRYMNGLTEVGTAMVVMHFMPELVNRSLISLSNPGTEKRYRKQVLTAILRDRLNIGVEFDMTEPPKKAMKWGTAAAVDFLSLYQIKHAGLEEASKTLSDIPQEAIDLADQLTLSFYERLNTNFMGTIPPEARADYLDKLATAGVYPYDERDWKELRIVHEMLQTYYSADAGEATKRARPRWMNALLASGRRGGPGSRP